VVFFGQIDKIFTPPCLQTREIEFILICEYAFHRLSVFLPCNITTTPMYNWWYRYSGCFSCGSMCSVRCYFYRICFFQRCLLEIHRLVFHHFFCNNFITQIYTDKIDSLLQLRDIYFCFIV
jgi:hypothetical protein